MFFKSKGGGPPTHRWVDRDPEVIAQERAAQQEALVRVRDTLTAQVGYAFGRPEDNTTPEAMAHAAFQRGGEQGDADRRQVTEEIQARSRNRIGLGREEDRLYGSASLDFLLDLVEIYNPVKTRELQPIDIPDVGIDKTILQQEARSGVLRLGSTQPADRRKGKREFLAPTGAQV